MAHLIVPLLKNVVYRDRDERLFSRIVDEQIAISDHLSVIGATLWLDESEGYAYVKNQETDEETPKLVSRRPLSYDVSLLLALLRKRLAEHDTHEGAARLIVTRDEVVALVSVFMNESPNEAGQVDKVESTINKVIDLGFMTKIRAAEHTYEVRRIIKAFIDAQWLQEFDAQLAAYAARVNPAHGQEM